MTTEAQVKELQKQAKSSGAKIHFNSHEWPPPEDGDDQGAEPSEDIFLIEMHDTSRQQVDITPSWGGSIKVFPDKEHRQIVLVSGEPTRSFSRKVTYNVYPQAKTAKSVVANERRALRKGSHFPVAVAPGSTFEILGKVTATQDDLGGRRWSINANVMVHIPDTEMCFLIGHDEKAMFVSMLPKTVTSVKAAHDALRPKGVPKDAIRQGEFFFVPAPEKEQKALDLKVIKAGATKMVYGGNFAAFLDDNESHGAQTVEYYVTDTYVLGWVMDRDERHVPIFFSTWHKVVDNLELDPPAGMDPDNWD